MSWELLSRFIESEHFNKDPSLTVAYLARYADHVGIHYVLCSKLRQFPYAEIEFFLPQLCHLLISIDNDSMALEEFLLDLCEESVNAALLTFWLLQTYLHDLSSTPGSIAFQTCRRLYNWVQSLVFGGTASIKRARIQDNILPVSVLSSLILSSVAAPFLPALAGPLAIGQARKPRPVQDVLSNVPDAQPSLARSNSLDSGTLRGKKHRSQASISTRRMPNGHHSVSQSTPEGSDVRQVRTPSHRQLLAVTNDGFASTSSLPDQRASRLALSSASLDLPRRPADLSRRHSHVPKVVPGATMTRDQQTRTLRQHYFRSEMQFLTALEGLAARLISVPKAARLSALRAELVLIARDLPAEVDIPLICPVSLSGGRASKSRHHRVVRLNPAEATSLNSAEKVPYLLILEVLRDDLDFDPDTDHNQQLLAKLSNQDSKQHRRLFDTTDATRREVLDEARQSVEQPDSVFEPTQGDLSSPALLQDPDDIPFVARSLNSSPRLRSGKDLPRLSSGVSTLASSRSVQTMSDVDLEAIAMAAAASSSRASPYLRPQLTDQAEYSALAVHMRTAAQMLAQLETSTPKRPKAEVAAIKARIIASMQLMEEQNFNVDESLPSSNFDAIMARSSNPDQDATSLEFVDEQLDTVADAASLSGRGAARMENDLKTGGVQRKGDRDDPSAAMFGEAWEQKKERIRRSSPYGWIKNWDLVSVIVKTGDDLRQEAFACQLIATCTKIWSEHRVKVWAKNMRILVTGESSGLIETITNAVSLHSLKRSLTLASIASGSNPKKRIATLQDHYTKTFGAVDSPGYARAIQNFVESLAAYSIISYMLQLKDRHNGNILIDSEGHVIHIDFGFMLSNSPGNMGFEAAPFKLTLEYVELLGGVEGQAFAQFKLLMKDAFQALRREAERIITLVELMGKDSKMPAYGSGLTSVVAALRARFVLEKSQEEARDVVDDLVAKSVGSYYTRLYDTYQYRTQGIY